MKTAIGKAVTDVLAYDREQRRESITVSEDEFADTSNVHGDGAKEVVVTIETDKTGWWDGSLKAAEDKDCGRVRDQETDETEKSRVG